MYITHPKKKKLINTTNGVGLDIHLGKSFLYQLLQEMMEYINKHKVLDRDWIFIMLLLRLKIINVNIL